MLYPIMTSSRFVSDLSGIWKFKCDWDGKGFDEKWQDSLLSESETMPVPASFNELKSDPKLREFQGWVFYQRNVTLPSFVGGQRVMLRFDAVTHAAKVFLNGELLCEHKGGFLPFECEITGKLKEGENLLTVAVNNRIDFTTLPVGRPGGMFSRDGEAKKDEPFECNFDFFNYSGINRAVRIYTTPLEYIKDITLTNKITGSDAEIFWEVEFSGKADSCQVEILDEDGKIVASGNGLKGSAIVKGVKLWQPLAAYLYTVRVKCGDDVYDEEFGVRSVEVKGNKFLINGRPFYFKGYGKHEDTFPNGRGTNLAMNTKDISLMKWQGANSFRTSHYPYSEEMMRQCDREGIVVIDETTAVGLNFQFGGGANFGVKKFPTFDPKEGLQTFEHHKDVIRDLISRDKNHACVVMWSIANEPDSYDPAAYDYFAPLYELARSLDKQKRPCTMASVAVGGKPKDDISLKLSDVICLNRYYGWYIDGGKLASAEKKLRAELDFWAGTGKPVVFTEYGADTVSGMHDVNATMWSEEYQVEYYKMNNKVFDSYECVTGEQVWNFADFATSQNIVRVQGNKKGLFTRDRQPKMAAYYFKERWHQIPDFDYEK